MDQASSNLYASANSVVKFNGLNYDEWSEQIRFTLGIMALDFAIITDEEPPAITDESSKDEISLYESWERSNRLSLILMRMTMAESIKPSMPKTEKAKEFMTKIKECSQSELADKSGSLMSELTNKKYDLHNSESMHTHVTEMSNLAAKLKKLGMEEEARLKKAKGSQVVHLVGHDGASSSKTHPSKKGKNKKGKNFIKGPEGKITKEKKCHFCNKKGHIKFDCPKRKAWFEKRGIQYDPAHKRT
ncbi:hypothetical protein RND81_01G102400 [Saponaria officinalis]|uniref:CCHC-type domain-containing protein n=1 Tax=Saponaria officinalis TaxID=3572 RepID=A0AAW1N6N7_SAPOF